ncbi:mechanosensitive ion channel [Candidatus Curtissbacteria bacterium]|nr:mechanosensitive ion channel [Candidatus Curtissbacteria bacterium]
MPVFRVILIIIVALILRVFIGRSVDTFVKGLAVGSPKSQRLSTVSSLLKTALITIIWVITFIMILKEIGFDITPILASAGIVGLAIGFGAQTLVKDVISGFFLLIENQFNEGDIISILDKKGVVEKISLRTVTIKDKDGVYHIIPNGSIITVSNFSRK